MGGEGGGLPCPEKKTIAPRVDTIYMSPLIPLIKNKIREAGSLWEKKDENLIILSRLRVKCVESSRRLKLDYMILHILPSRQPYIPETPIKFKTYLNCLSLT